MKNFTCLLVAFLAFSSIYTAATDCPTAANSFQLRLDGQTASTSKTGATSAVQTADANTCGVSGTNLCCVVANMQTLATAEVTKVKNNLVNFGSNIARIGGMWAKINTLVSGAASTAFDSAAAGDLSGATTAQLKTWGTTYTGAMFDTDFAAFKTAVPDCFTAYSNAILKIACSGCAAGSTTAPTYWTTDATTTITATGCTELTTKCAKVWNFLHKAGWFIQAVAYLNKNKGSGITYSPPTTVYAPGADTLANIDTAIGKCGADPTVAACDTTQQAVLCKSFFAPWGNIAQVVGRTDNTFVVSTYNPVSTVTRRILGPTALTGAVVVGTGVDTSSTNTVTMTLASPVTLVANDLTAWSSGYVAPASGTSSSGGTTTTTSSKSSAQVLIGTVLSAIFAVALLN